jgi:hypothetical protein
MKQIFLTGLLGFFLTTQIVHAQSDKQLAEVLQLVVPREGGANAAAVAWHPEFKHYYAAMAGNADFFLGVYDTKGRLQSSKELSTLFDIRGLWYNTKNKSLQMNGYGENGWAQYVLDSKGFPTDIEILHEGLNQPDEQSVGAFNSAKQIVYFLNSDGYIEIYDVDGASYQELIELTLGKTAVSTATFSNADIFEEYNFNGIIYNGKEIGLLNFEDKAIELYSPENGKMVRRLILPDDAPVKEFMNFSWCNGIYWLFDGKTRIWKGYK